MWRAIIILLLASPVATENAITYNRLRKDSRILHIRCSAESIAVKGQVAQITISNCTSKDRPPTRLAWASDERPERLFDSINMFLATDISKENNPDHLDILMTGYDPSFNQTFCCYIGYAMDGENFEMNWNITVTEGYTYEDDKDDECNTIKITLGVFLSLLGLPFLYLPITCIIMNRRRHASCNQRNQDVCPTEDGYIIPVDVYPYSKESTTDQTQVKQLESDSFPASEQATTVNNINTQRVYSYPYTNYLSPLDHIPLKNLAKPTDDGYLEVL